MPTIDMIATGKNIRAMRIAAGMTIDDVTRACGVSRAAVAKWQRGDAIPTIDNLVILASVWNVRVDDIIIIICHDKTACVAQSA